MHSAIFQISNQPISYDILFDEADICIGPGIDYVDLLPVNEKIEKVQRLADLVNDLAPVGETILSPTYDGNLSYNGNIQLLFKTLMDKFSQLTNLIFEGKLLFSDQHQALVNVLARLLNNPLGTAFLFMTDSSETEPSKSLLTTLSSMKKGDILYIGSVFDYHF